MMTKKRKLAEKIAQELNITEEDLKKRMDFLQITQEDIRNLVEFRRRLGELPESLFDEFYEHITQFEEVRAVLKDEATIRKIKKKQRIYFEEMLSGKYDTEYVLSRLRVGFVHVQLDIVPLWYIGAFNKYIEQFKAIIYETVENHAETFQSFSKIIMLDIILTLESYHYAKYRFEKELKKMIVTDELTGIYNRRKFEEAIQFEMQRSDRHNTGLCLLMMDIDHFKSVNDTYGHPVGDQVLKTLTRTVKQILRKTDYFVRFGGEEFVIIATDTRLEGARKIGEKVRQRVENHHFETVRHITISIGVAEYREGDSKERLLARADKALYQAKQGGRNQVCW